jgi:cytolysin (calcineurin-like family phosphatase)
MNGRNNPQIHRSTVHSASGGTLSLDWCNNRVIMYMGSGSQVQVLFRHYMPSVLPDGGENIYDKKGSST